MYVYSISIGRALRELGYSVHDFEEHLEEHMDMFNDYFDGFTDSSQLMEAYRQVSIFLVAKLFYNWGRSVSP